MVRLPLEPPPGPKKKLEEPDGDFKKYGEVMFPTGGPSFVLLKRLLTFIERLSV